MFVVDDLDRQFDRIAATGVRVVTPPETEPWGERFCQFADANGLIWQLVQWVNWLLARELLLPPLYAVRRC